MYYIQLILLGGTPRNAWAKRNNLNTPAFGEIFPATSLIVVISEHQTLARRSPCSAPRLNGPLLTAISYSIISPVATGLGWLAFFLTYYTQKYLFTWVVSPFALDKSLPPA